MVPSGSDDAFIAAGVHTTDDGGRSILLTRLGSTGGNTAGFGQLGTVFVDAGQSSEPGDLVVDSDQSILVTNGNALGVRDPMYFIARFLKDGTPDTSFGTGGAAQPLRGIAKRMAITEGGRKLLVLGEPPFRGERAMRLARYWLR